MASISLEPSIKGPYKFLDHFPRYLTQKESVHVGSLAAFYHQVLVLIFRSIIILVLKANGKDYSKFETRAKLSQQDITEIYKREALTYEFKHHFTTHYRDTWWRRALGFGLLSEALTIASKEFSILDVGTGIGLSLEEILRVFKLFNRPIRCVGLDYSQHMLDQAMYLTMSRLQKEGLLSLGEREVKFVRGDVHQLIKPTGRQSNNLVSYAEKSFDAVTNMFALGGFEQPLQALEQELRILKENGKCFVLDIHRPVTTLREKWPWYIAKKNGPHFVLSAWQQVTKPIVLKSVWGWHDPTAIFYLAPHVSYQDQAGIYFGFRLQNLELNNEYWWFKLPVITTCKLVLQKVRIEKETYIQNQALLAGIQWTH